MEPPGTRKCREFDWLRTIWSRRTLLQLAGLIGFGVLVIRIVQCKNNFELELIKFLGRCSVLLKFVYCIFKIEISDFLWNCQLLRRSCIPIFFTLSHIEARTAVLLLELRISVSVLSPCQMWSVIPKIPVVNQLVKEFLAFYAHHRFITLYESLPIPGPVYHYTTCWLYSEKLLAPCPSSKLKGHLLKVSLNLLHILAATLVCHGDRWSAQSLYSIAKVRFLKNGGSGKSMLGKLNTIKGEWRSVKHNNSKC
jgi:hypothetical protein